MHISRLTMLCGTALLMAACGDQGGEATTDEQPQSGPIEEAPAVSLMDGNGQIIGSINAGDSAEGVVLQISARGLPPGEHGMHIHDIGRCEPPTFESAGPHWNPESKQHGLHNEQGPHRGDLPNVTVGPDGQLQATVTIEGSNLRGSRAYGFANQVLDENGAALVIHAQADDMVTDPSGDSGERIACAELAGATLPQS